MKPESSRWRSASHWLSSIQNSLSVSGLLNCDKDCAISYFPIRQYSMAASLCLVLTATLSVWPNVDPKTKTYLQTKATRSCAKTDHEKQSSQRSKLLELCFLPQIATWRPYFHYREDSGFISLFATVGIKNFTIASMITCTLVCSKSTVWFQRLRYRVGEAVPLEIETLLSLHTAHSGQIAWMFISS